MTTQAKVCHACVNFTSLALVRGFHHFDAPRKLSFLLRNDLDGLASSINVTWFQLSGALLVLEQFLRSAVVHGVIYISTLGLGLSYVADLPCGFASYYLAIDKLMKRQWGSRRNTSLGVSEFPKPLLSGRPDFQLLLRVQIKQTQIHC